MNMPECARCDENVRDLCKQLFEGYAAIDKDGVEKLQTEGIIDAIPGEALDFMNRKADEAVLEALGVLSHWECGLTEEQVKQRILLAKGSI